MGGWGLGCMVGMMGYVGVDGKDGALNTLIVTVHHVYAASDSCGWLMVCLEMVLPGFSPVTIKRASIANQKLAVTCLGCGAQGHFKSKYPRLKNQNHDNQKGKEGKTRKNSKVVKDFTDA
ncbi:hypothetical protein Tco_0880576 [Tanacetum coccineum]